MYLFNLQGSNLQFFNLLSGAVEEAKAYIQSAPIVGADETGFGHLIADGQNPHQKRAWLWVAVTPLVTFFQVMLSRSGAAAQSLLGKSNGSILNSDRLLAYNWIDVAQRQLCWAHLKREFTKISERSGVSRQLGRDLLAQQKKLFRLRRTSFGSQSEAGSVFVARMLTVVTSLRSQERNVLEFMTAAVRASREGTLPPGAASPTQSVLSLRFSLA